MRCSRRSEWRTREVNQRERDRGADPLDYRLGPAGPLEHEPHDGDESDENADAGELAQPELLRRRVEQRGVAVGERFPREHGEDDGDEVAERREDEEARVTLGGLEITGDAEPDEEADIHAGVVPEEGSFAARILRGEALREHHVDAGDVEAAAGEEEGEADVEQRERAGRDACAAEHLQRHAPDKQVAVRKKTAAQVTAEEVQAVVECAEHAHQRGGRFHAEMQMLRRVEDQRRVEDGEAERREDLNEEQRSRSLRSVGETACEKFHPALLCRSTCRVMSSGSQACRLRVCCSGTRVACVHWRIAADTAASTVKQMIKDRPHRLRSLSRAHGRSYPRHLGLSMSLIRFAPSTHSLRVSFGSSACPSVSLNSRWLDSATAASTEALDSTR